MQKSKLNRFIQKYNLNGNVNSVKWKSQDKILSTNFITSDKSLMGTVNLNNFDFMDSEIGVYTTDQLQRLLSVLSEDINLDVTKYGERPISLKIKNRLILLYDMRKLKKIKKF